MADKKVQSWCSKDVAWLWEERLRRQERRERIERGELVVRGDEWQDEEDELWVTRWRDGEIEWVRYREGPEWDSSYLAYVARREREEARGRALVGVFEGLGQRVREEGVGRGLGAHYPRPGGTPEVLARPGVWTERE